MLVQPGDRSLDHPAFFAEARAVAAATFGDSGGDATLAKRCAVLATAIGTISKQRLGAELAMAPSRGTRSTSANSSVMSLRFAAVNVTARGMPWPSQITWCFEPGRRRSTGEGPVFSPPLLPAHASCRRPPATSPTGRSPAIHPTAPGASVPRPQRRSNPATFANRSSPTHTPSPAAGPPTGCPS